MKALFEEAENQDSTGLLEAYLDRVEYPKVTVVTRRSLSLLADSRLRKDCRRDRLSTSPSRSVTRYLYLRMYRIPANVGTIRTADAAGFTASCFQQIYTVSSPLIHAGQLSLFYPKLIEKNYWNELQSSVFNDARSHRLPPLLRPISLFWRMKWHQPGNGGHVGIWLVHIQRQVSREFDVAVAAEFWCFLWRNFEKSTYLTCKHSGDLLGEPQWKVVIL